MDGWMFGTGFRQGVAQCMSSRVVRWPMSLDLYFLNLFGYLCVAANG